MELILAFLIGFVSITLLYFRDYLRNEYPTFMNKFGGVVIDTIFLLYVFFGGVLIGAM